MTAQQQLASVLLALLVCAHGQYLPYGEGLSGIQTGQVPAANIIRAPPLPNAPISSGPAVNLNLPLGHSYKPPEGAYGIGSVVKNGRISIPPGATVAAGGNGRLTDVLGLSSIYIERGVNGGPLGSPGRLVRIQKRSADESLDERLHYVDDLSTAASELTGAGVVPRHAKQDAYDRVSLYKLAKEALKKNPRKGISFKKPEGKYGVASIFDSVNPLSDSDTEKHKKLEDGVSHKYPFNADAPSSPEEALRALADHQKGVSQKKSEGGYSIAPVFDRATLFNPFIYRRHKRQAVGSGSVTAVLVDFDKDTDTPVQPPSAPTSSFAPVVGFTVQEPEGGTPSKHILKNVIYRKRPGDFKPALSPHASPTKPVLRIPDSIELPPLGGVPHKTGEESPDIQTVALPASSHASPRPKPIVSRKTTSTATIEFRPTFPVEHIKPALPPLPRPSTPLHSKGSHSNTDTSSPKKTPAKSASESHKLAETPLVAVPAGQVVYNRQLSASVPVQPVRNVALQSRPPAVPTPTLRPTATAQRVLTQPQVQAVAQPTARVQPQIPAHPNIVAAAPPQQTLQVQPAVVAAPPPPAPAPQLQTVAASPYPGALYQQYTPLDPNTYQVAQPTQYQTFQHSPYALPYAAIVADPYTQARIVRSTVARLRQQQASPFHPSSVYDLTKRIIQGVHS